MAENTQKTEAEKAPEKKLSAVEQFRIAETFGNLKLTQLRSKPNKFKRVKELEAAEKEAKALKGMKALKTQTLWHKGVKLTIVEGYSVPKSFTDSFDADQKKQYFK